MSTYCRRTSDRADFIRCAFADLAIDRSLVGISTVLLKPNIVSSEPYPTTTHPSVVEACLEYFLDRGFKVVVADGPAFDAGRSGSILNRHPLKHVCDRYGVPLIDLLGQNMVKKKAKDIELELSQAAFQYDFILSLPVLKSHFVCGLTGALKNQFGFLSAKQRLKLHMSRDIHRAIAELNLIVRPHFYVMDAIETLIKANEVRHGGEKAELGYMLAGRDPVELDIAGLKILQTVETRLAGKSPEDIPHLRHAIELGIGSTGGN